MLEAAWKPNWLAPYDQNKETKNSRNGYRERTVHTEYGELPIQVPRDRLGEFEPVVEHKFIIV